MLDSLTKLSNSKIYWACLLGICALMEGIALFYQYGLDYGPCVLCIHIRIWIAALIIVALFALFTPNCRHIQRASHIGAFLVAIGLTERSWQTLAVERGWVEGACNMDSGLPDWFALDKWLPEIFEPWEPCGYTPELLFGITMAEGLMVFSASLVAISAFFCILQFRRASI